MGILEKVKTSAQKIWQAKYRKVRVQVFCWIITVLAVFLFGEDMRENARIYWYIELVAYFGWIIPLISYYKIRKNKNE